MPVLGVKPIRGWYVFWIFFKITLRSALKLKWSRRELSIDVAEHISILENKGVVRILLATQSRAISFKRSRRELSTNVAEHRCALKNYLNTPYPRFSFIPKTGIESPKMGILFLLCKVVRCFGWCKWYICGSRHISRKSFHLALSFGTVHKLCIKKKQQKNAIFDIYWVGEWVSSMSESRGVF